MDSFGTAKKIATKKRLSVLEFLYMISDILELEHRIDLFFIGIPDARKCLESLISRHSPSLAREKIIERSRRQEVPSVMEPFIKLFLLGVTTPIRLACDIISGVAEGLVWYGTVEGASIKHCESDGDFLPTISCAHRIKRPVKVVVESVVGPVHLIIHPDDWIDEIGVQFRIKRRLRAATWRDIFLGKDTPIPNTKSHRRNEL
jgi:hypothetical protein